MCRFSRIEIMSEHRGIALLEIIIIMTSMVLVIGQYRMSVFCNRYCKTFL